MDLEGELEHIRQKLERKTRKMRKKKEIMMAVEINEVSISHAMATEQAEDSL